MMGSNDQETSTEGSDMLVEESRRVLDHQIAKIDALDEKAAWTLRIGVVLLGIVVSAIELLPSARTSGLVIIGTVVLALSLAVGLFTYGVSRVDIGAAPEQFDRILPSNYGRAEVCESLLVAHDRSISFNRRSFWTSGLFLTLTHVLMIIGIWFFAAGVLASF